jgi:hypothetical protein
MNIFDLTDHQAAHLEALFRHAKELTEAAQQAQRDYLGAVAVLVPVPDDATVDGQFDRKRLVVIPKTPSPPVPNEPAPSD